MTCDFDRGVVNLNELTYFLQNISNLIDCKPCFFDVGVHKFGRAVVMSFETWSFIQSELRKSDNVILCNIEGVIKNES